MFPLRVIDESLEELEGGDMFETLSTHAWAITKYSNPLFGCTELGMVLVNLELGPQFRCLDVLGIGSWNRGPIPNAPFREAN